MMQRRPFQVTKKKTQAEKGDGFMLWTIFVILLIMWLLGLVSGYAMGGFVHILLVLAVVALVFQLLTGRRAAL